MFLPAIAGGCRWCFEDVHGPDGPHRQGCFGSPCFASLEILDQPPWTATSSEVCGPPEATTAILWLHGYGFHANLERMWKKVCHISESLNSLVIACDLEGHGYSDGPQSIENCENLVQDVVDLCTDLTSTSAGSFSTDLGSLKRTLLHQKLFLGGESFGGAIALQASLQQSIPQLKGFLVVIAVD